MRRKSRALLDLCYCLLYQSSVNELGRLGREHLHISFKCSSSYFLFLALGGYTVVFIIFQLSVSIILINISNSLKTFAIYSKFHGDHECLVRFEDSPTVEELLLTFGILPENLHETGK
jgi:hypothetical protein